MRRYVITGAPGTGKSALLGAFASHGTATVNEPARELIAEHRAATGEPSLDHRPELFVSRLVRRSIEKYDDATGDIVIYDRGLPDCIAYAEAIGVDPGPALRAAGARRYAQPVLIAAPWREIYHTDGMRRATFDQVVDFHAHIVRAYESLGYELVELPAVSIEERREFVVAVLGF